MSMLLHNVTIQLILGKISLEIRLSGVSAPVHVSSITFFLVLCSLYYVESII